MASTSEDKLDQILSAISTTKQELSTKVDAVSVEIGLLRADHQKLVIRVIQVECDMAEICPTVKELGSMCYSEHIMCHVRSCSSPRDPIQRLGYGFSEFDPLGICPYHVYEAGIPVVASQASIFCGRVNIHQPCGSKDVRCVMGPVYKFRVDTPHGPTPQFCFSGESPLEMRPAGGTTFVALFHHSSR
ncbi:hypothetical protein NDU88_002958 [Pleurodeles waltl]|uniref:Uncharacterized protein n=1 Tax=Pleurodeles waltl TaxID=8319 RepID=A0AAV7UB72_PLEWA|nr:hypothetical protein NDU88_002958 [Pleurodeles waltl]